MKFILLSVSVVLLMSCSSDLSQWHLLKAVELCNGVENIDEMEKGTNNWYVTCTDSLRHEIKRGK